MHTLRHFGSFHADKGTKKVKSKRMKREKSTIF